MVIETGSLRRDSLAGRVAVVTGAGGGIGYEAARSLVWLGCKVVVAEIDPKTGRQAAERLDREFGPGVALFVRTDVGDEASVRNLARRAESAFGPVDVVVNNATVAPLGAVKDVDIRAWDASYRVNLRGPVLLARAFIPGMIARNRGVFACVSSTGLAYMGAYESLKAAQVHLATTLSEELEGTEVAVFAIGPGFVPTQTALSSIPRLAALMGKSESELRAVVSAYELPVEAAGAGFAAAVAMASRYRGQEISSVQALADAGISLPSSKHAVECPPRGLTSAEHPHPEHPHPAYQTSGRPPSEVPPSWHPHRGHPASERQQVDSERQDVARATLGQTTYGRGLSPEQFEEASALCRSVRKTLAEQSAGWRDRPVFERQWLVRAFRRHASMSVDEWLRVLEQLELALQDRDASAVARIAAPLDRLAAYYAYLHKMAEGYVKDPLQRDEQLGIVRGWQEEVERLRALVEQLA
ncbi:MAG: SDR family oxidoreductase [Firmicutes bacterium]|nr:SDR family oxidoreductase [Bacillota bacterium]